MLRALRFALPALAAIAVACGGTTTSNGNGTGADGGSSSGGSGSSSGSSGGHDAGGDPCAGLGCASMPGHVWLHVLGASGSPVASPSFSENGQPLQATCINNAGVEIDGGASCETWLVEPVTEGAHTITVVAPGYASQALTVTVEGPAGCCGEGPTVEETVTLAPAPSDGGATD